MAYYPFSLFILFLLLSLTTTTTTSLPLSTISAASTALSTANFTSISLTLSLLSTTPLFSSLSSATLFTPDDSSFSLLPSAQPPLSLLLLHFSPRLLSPSDLRSLPRLPSLLPNKTLTLISDTHNKISINGVDVAADSPLFRDGFLSIFAIDNFFDPNFTSPSPAPSPGGVPACEAPRPGSSYEGLRAKNYSAMAGFLEVQLISGYYGGVTVFAPADDAMEGQFGNYSNWGRVFRRHVVPCELSWGDLVGMEGGVVLSTFLDGFVINVTISGEDNSTLLLNGEITVDFPELYHGDRIVVHGLSGMLSAPEWIRDRDEEGADSPGDRVHHGEF